MKHTPGPWNACPSGTPEYFRQYLISSESDPSVTTLALVYSGSEAEANAQLLAAAPELLEALQNLLEAVDNSAGNLKHWPDAKQARAAIKKATGD